MAGNLDENIWIAAGDGDLEKVQQYVAAGASVDAQDTNGYTPLAAAASYSRHAVLGWLLERGAAPNLGDSEGARPLRVGHAAAGSSSAAPPQGTRRCTWPRTRNRSRRCLR